MNKVIFLVGPTAVGKTDVSILLAQKINAEIISADSMQVYKGMDITTSKPAPCLREKVPHHLIDVLDPDREYSAAEFQERAERLIREIHARGRIPLVAGGSGLYVQALLDGIFPDRSADWKVRNKFYQEAEEKGSAYLYQRLKKIDPETAASIQPNDQRRIIRALEVYEHTKIPISKLRKNTQGIAQRYEIKIFGLIRPRAQLYQRIEQRVDKMFELGLVEEVKQLVNKYRLGLSASQALGYKEIKPYLEGKYSLEQAKILLKRNTRRFAKRQLTWFKRDKRIQWIELKEQPPTWQIIQKISSFLK